jgi:hypothetical protein
MKTTNNQGVQVHVHYKEIEVNWDGNPPKIIYNTKFGVGRYMHIYINKKSNLG